MLRKCWRKLELDQVGTAKSWQTESRIESWGPFWIHVKLLLLLLVLEGQNEASDSATEVATWPQKVEIEALLW